MNTAKLKAIGVAALLVIGALSVGAMLSYKQVGEGYTGVTKEWGAVNGEELSAGPHWKMPVAQSVKSIETRPRDFTFTNDPNKGSTEGPDAVGVKSINGTQHNVDISVRYRIQKSGAAEFVSEYNNIDQFEQRFLVKEVRGAVYTEGGGMTQDEIFTQKGRDRFATATDKRLKERSPDYVIIEAVIVRYVSIPDSLSDDYEELEGAKIDARTQKEQVEVEKAKKEQRIVQAEADAEEARIAARADADATRIRGEALDRHPIVLEQQRIDAYREAGAIYVGAEEPEFVRETNEDENEDN